MQFEYRALDGHTYHVSISPTEYLRKWLNAEWITDVEEYPDQKWTPEWMRDLALLEFRLELRELATVKPRPDVMSYSKDGYDFQAKFQERVAERVDAIQMGTSIMPLVVRAADHELMDGYTRFAALQRIGALRVLAYVGYQVDVSHR